MLCHRHSIGRRPLLLEFVGMLGVTKPTQRKGSQRLHIGSAVQQSCVLSFSHECWLRIGATKRSHECVGSYKELAEDDGRR
jgi:hypothetical protein